MNKRILISLTAAVLFAAVLGVAFQAHAATYDTAEGSFAINAQPSVTDVQFCNDAYGLVSALDPDGSTYWRLNFTVSDSATMADINNCTIWIYDDSLFGANYNTSAETGYNLTSFTWTEAAGTGHGWAVQDQGALSGWTVDNSTSDDPGAGGAQTSYEFSMRFQISKVANYDTDWNATVHVYDDDTPPAEWDAASETGLVTFNEYYEVTYSVGTFSWGTDVQPSSDNNTHGALTVTIIANRQWELQINATDFNTSGQSDVDIEANDILCWDEDGSEGGVDSQWIRNTIATLQTGTAWDNQLPTGESGEVLNCYFFLNPGAFFAAGYTWSTWVTVWAQANT